MAAIDFPSSPTINQTFTSSGITWQWNGATWDNISFNLGQQGAQGPIGLQGTQGSQGPTGTQGSQGPTGTQGNQGPIGLQGNNGSNGQQGFQGPIGLQGSIGSQGNQGPIGLQGSVGAQGNNGSNGQQGFQGPIGLQGNVGAQGSTGAQGFQGRQGPIGPQGFQGNNGSNGGTGAQGFQGPIGLQGSVGAQGSFGAQGFQGRQGPAGPQGFQGFQGNNGSNGGTGAQGLQGPQGFQGNNGSNGGTGAQGFQGPSGPGTVSGTTGYISRFTGSTSLGNSEIFQSGTNIGIGTTSPSNKLHVAGGGITVTNEFIPDGINGIHLGFGGDQVGRIYTLQNNVAWRILEVLAAQINLVTQGSTRLIITTSGNVLIGTSTDTGDLLRVQGSISTSGVIRGGDDIIAYYSSDKRLKDNIVKIDSPLEKISKISGYSFDWNSNQDTYTGKDYGVIAQEIEQIFPELVTTRDNGYKAVKYEKLIPLLIESIKELKTELDILKNK